jgi:hypothetical protein
MDRTSCSAVSKAALRAPKRLAATLHVNAAAAGDDDDIPPF